MSFLIASSFLSAAWQRVKVSRFCVLYISFIVVFAIVQIGLRAQVFALDSRSSHILDTLLETGRVQRSGIPILTSNGSLQLCPSLASTGSFGSCSTIWDPSDGQIHILVREEPTSLSDPTCLMALNFPYYVLRSDLREDVVSICLQLFALGLAVTAMMHKHLSHFLSGAMLQVISVLWAAIRVSDTGKSAAQFTSVITNGACGGEVLGNFWDRRFGFDVAVLALDLLGLLLSVVFGWKAAQNLGLTKPEMPHLSSSTNKLYRVMVAALTTIELSLFFTVAAGILWVDHLFFLDASAAGLGNAAKALYILATILIVPVLILGWIALHREMWKSILVFLPCSFIYLTGWGLSFVLTQFRFVVLSWRLFGVISIITFLLAYLTFVFGLTTACYFGKGLKLISQGKETPGHEFTRSASSLEKGELSYSVDSPRDNLETIHTIPALPYQQRVPKAKATAISRGLTISPPPLR